VTVGGGFGTGDDAGGGGGISGPANPPVTQPAPHVELDSGAPPEFEAGNSGYTSIGRFPTTHYTPSVTMGTLSNA
jgi:hypothetical protein